MWQSLGARQYEHQAREHGFESQNDRERDQEAAVRERSEGVAQHSHREAKRMRAGGVPRRDIARRNSFDRSEV